MKKAFAVYFLLTLFQNILLSQTNQDQIFLNDKTVISGKIIRVTANAIEIDPEGEKPFQIVKRSDVNILIYSDNTIVDFKNETENKESNSEVIKKKMQAVRINRRTPSIEDEIKLYESFELELPNTFILNPEGSEKFKFLESIEVEFEGIEYDINMDVNPEKIDLQFDLSFDWKERTLSKDVMFNDLQLLIRAKHNDEEIVSLRCNYDGEFGISSSRDKTLNFETFEIYGIKIEPRLNIKYSKTHYRNKSSNNFDLNKSYQLYIILDLLD